jgi:hypothetical protein
MEFGRRVSSHFAIDEKQIKAEPRFDGIWVLRTNTDYNAETVADVYENLWTVETSFAPPNRFSRPGPFTIGATRPFGAMCFAVSWPFCSTQTAVR